MDEYTRVKLRFADEAEAKAHVFDNGVLRYPFTQIRGIIYTPAVWGDEGIIKPAVAHSGYHVDIATKDELASDLIPFIVVPEPESASFAWAGEDDNA